MYRNAEASELAELHPSDRLMVQLIKIDRLGPRIEGMLYKLSFNESWTLLDEVARLILDCRPFIEAYFSGCQETF